MGEKRVWWRRMHRGMEERTGKVRGIGFKIKFFSKVMVIGYFCLRDYLWIVNLIPLVNASC